MCSTCGSHISLFDSSVSLLSGFMFIHADCLTSLVSVWSESSYVWTWTKWKCWPCLCICVFIISALPSLMDFHYSYICMSEALYQQHIYIWLGGSKQPRTKATQASVLCKRLFILLGQQKRIDFCYQNMQSGLSVMGISSTERTAMYGRSLRSQNPLVSVLHFRSQKVSSF